MIRSVLRPILLGGAVTAMANLPPTLMACAACFGRSNDSMAHGMNMAILALLLVVLAVLTGVASFGIFLARRASRFSTDASAPAAPAELPAELPQPNSPPTQ
jgi:hypothetical protein